MTSARTSVGSATDLARRLGEALGARGWRLAVAESCTGGGLGWVLTSVPGSSTWFDRGFITYSNAAKEQLLGVPGALLARHGAVSAATVRAMARGALARSDAQVAIAVSGIAGPGGGTPARPVGTVWMAWVAPGLDPLAKRWHFAGDRDAVRRQAISEALAGAVDMLAAGARS